MPDRAVPSDRNWGFKTRSIHAGNIPDAVSGSRALPIYQSSAFVFDDTADAAARFALQKYGNIYSRLANPTVASASRPLGEIVKYEPASSSVRTWASKIVDSIPARWRAMAVTDPATPPPAMRTFTRAILP